jgi:hypothetical protein
MGCAEVQRLLEDQVTACRGEVTVLRAELDRINVLVAERESDLMRLVAALEVVAALPALPALHPAPAAPAAFPLAGAGPGALPASVPVLVAAGSEPEAFTAAVLAPVNAGPAGGMRCRDVVEAMGQEVVPRRVERVRHHGKRLVQRGQLAEIRGLFTLPPQRQPARG